MISRPADGDRMGELTRPYSTKHEYNRPPTFEVKNRPTEAGYGGMYRDNDDIKKKGGAP